MPSPVQYQSREKQFADAHEELKFKMDQAQLACYQALEQYNPGYGSMPECTYRVPNTDKILKFKLGAGEIELNTTLYSSLDASGKKIVFQYLDKLTKSCLDNYDIFYNV